VDLGEYDKTSELVKIDKVLNGQALTCKYAIEEKQIKGALMIAPCDNGMLYDEALLQQLIKDNDVVVFAFKGAAAVEYNASAYTWVVPADNYKVDRLSCKQPVSIAPKKDWAITGAFWFKDVSMLTEAIDKIQEKTLTVNGEYYVDTCINECIAAGLSVAYMPIAHYIGWGTPNDVKTYNYWSSYFNN
jgi:bifunctional N-acetylglucosamine-1-phosphate-uridyltransferase/glucosamine-1-phosphate-acetyltransferase GlmU-like protein